MITEKEYKKLKSRRFLSLNGEEQAQLSVYENNMVFNKIKNFIKEKAKERVL